MTRGSSPTGCAIIRFIAIAHFLATPSVVAQQPVEVIRFQNGSMQTKLGYGIVLNEGSSLMREALVVRDPQLPLELSDRTALVTEYDDRSYQYRARYTITPREPIAALEVRFIVFDVWGRHIASYYVNKNAQPNGDHEVHAAGCSYFPESGNAQHLGEFSNCRPAV